MKIWRPTKEVVKNAFTLLELLFSCFILGLIISITLPFLSRSKQHAQAILCMRNLQDLYHAWMMYSDDHNGWIPQVKQGGLPGPDTWISGWLDLTTSPDNTNTIYLTDERYAQIGPYVTSARPFRCPADPSTVTIEGKSYLRVRSVSMNCWMNYNGSDPLILSQGYRIYRKFTDMWDPPPSSLWVIIDERFETINDGMFYLNLVAKAILTKITDFPANYHNNGAGIVFADGHSVIKKWIDPRTTPSYIQPSTRFEGFLSPYNPDIRWLQDHASAPLRTQQPTTELKKY